MAAQVESYEYYPTHRAHQVYFKGEKVYLRDTLEIGVVEGWVYEYRAGGRMMVPVYQVRFADRVQSYIKEGELDYWQPSDEELESLPSD